MTRPDYLSTKIFLDSGTPAETRAALGMLGFLDGQTTNPSLVAKNPEIMELKAKGSLTPESVWQAYREVALHLREILPDGSISVEVYADHETTHEQMLQQGRMLSTWFPGVFVKLPVTEAGLKTANVLSAEGINLNMTLCFTQDQAAAVHAATKGAARGTVYVSPFVGRLDDIGLHGMDLIRNVATMYQSWGSHVMVLGASVRNLDHLFGCFVAGADIVTAPLSVIEEWAKSYGVEKNPGDHVFAIAEGAAIAFRDLPEQDWMLYDIHHALTEKGIEKFSQDWKNLFEN